MNLIIQSIIAGLCLAGAVAWIIVKIVKIKRNGAMGCSCCELHNSCATRKMKTRTPQGSATANGSNPSGNGLCHGGPECHCGKRKA